MSGKPDRAAFARRHAPWLAVFFGVCLAFGLLTGRVFLVLAGLAGLGWLWLARRGPGA